MKYIPFWNQYACTICGNHSYRVFQKKKCTSLDWDCEKTKNVIKLNSSPFERGKANLNFALSYFEFASRVQELWGKFKKILFRKSVIFEKKVGIKSQAYKTLKKLFFNIFSTPKDSRAFRMFWLSKGCKKNRWNRIVLITVIKTLKWLYWITTKHALFSHKKEREKKFDPHFFLKNDAFSKENFLEFSS